MMKSLKWIFFNFWKKYRITNIKNKKHFLFFMNNYLKMSIIHIYNKNKTKQQLDAYKNNMKKQIEKVFQRIHNNNIKKYLTMKTSLKQKKFISKQSSPTRPNRMKWLKDWIKSSWQQQKKCCCGQVCSKRFEMRQYWQQITFAIDC